MAHLTAGATGRGPSPAVVGGETAPVATPLAVVVTAALLVVMQLYVAIPIAPVVGDDLGGAATTPLNTAYSLAYAAGFVVWGPISDRFGRRAVLIPGMVALAAATAGPALVSSLAAVGALRAAQGFIAASFAAVALAYLAEALPPRRRAIGIGAVSTAFLVAGIAGQVYAQGVVLALGWRWVFGLAAAAFAVIAVLMAVLLGEPTRSGTPASLGRRYSQMVGLLRRRDMTWLYLAAMTVLLAFVALYTALGPVLQARFGSADHDILLVRLAGLPGMAFAPLAGALVNRHGPPRVAVGGFLTAAAGLVLTAVTGGMLGGLVVGSAVFVAGIATVVPALITLVGSRAGEARAGATGLYGLALFLGASTGSAAAGLGLGFTALLLCLAALLLLAAALVAGSVPRATDPG